MRMQIQMTLTLHKRERTKPAAADRDHETSEERSRLGGGDYVIALDHLMFCSKQEEEEEREPSGLPAPRF